MVAKQNTTATREKSSVAFCLPGGGDYMPKRPKRPCSYPGCRRLTDSRFCNEHKQVAEHQYNRYLRDPDTNKRYGRAWKKIRAYYIQVHPLCEQCEQEGRLTPAEEVHHILPLANGGTHDDDNLMALCKSCHSRITIGSNNTKHH